MYTGQMSDAGTDADVHLMLIGERGDTGYRQLLKPLSADLSQPFQPGQVNTTVCEFYRCYSCLTELNMLAIKLAYMAIFEADKAKLIVCHCQQSD